MSPFLGNIYLILGKHEMQCLYQILCVRNYIGAINIFIIHSLLFLSFGITCPQMVWNIEVHLLFHGGSNIPYSFWHKLSQVGTEWPTEWRSVDQTECDEYLPR